MREPSAADDAPDYEPFLTRNGVTTHECRMGQPTVTPSIDCPDCDLHGFVVDGWWRG